jgi:hypothetical protein
MFLIIGAEFSVSLLHILPASSLIYIYRQPDKKPFMHMHKIRLEQF